MLHQGSARPDVARSRDRPRGLRRSWRALPQVWSAPLTRSFNWLGSATARCAQQQDGSAQMSRRTPRSTRHPQSAHRIFTTKSVRAVRIAQLNAHGSECLLVRAHPKMVSSAKRDPPKERRAGRLTFTREDERDAEYLSDATLANASIGSLSLSRRSVESDVRRHQDVA